MLRCGSPISEFGLKLEATDLAVLRGGKHIVSGVSASLEGARLVAVIGPNGAGKSTLLSALAGLLKLDNGDVRLDGVSLSDMDRRVLARRRAYLPQNARCEWPISVERVVALGLTPTLSALGELSAEDAKRVEETLARADLLEKRAQAATTLSGGELARTMLARAIVGAPEVLVADEPIAGLDPRHALDAMRRMRGLSEEGCLVIVALHDLALAARYADRVLALKDGKLVADGAPDEVLTPALLRDVFDVDARVTRDAEGVTLHLVGPA